MFKRALNLLTVLFLVGVCMPLIACASGVDAVPDPSYSANIEEGVGAVITIFFTVITGLVTYLVSKAISLFERKTGIHIDDSTRAYLDKAIEAGIELGKVKITKYTEGYNDVQLRSQIAAETLTYVSDMVPDAIAHFGLTPEKLKALIDSRLASKEIVTGVA